MQALGSALTYAQRYSVRLLLNLTSEDDDDGQQAPERPEQQERPRHDMRPRQPANETPSRHETGDYAGLSVGTKPARGDPAKQDMEAKAREFVRDSMAMFATLDEEGLRLWWRDSAERRDAVSDLYPDLHQKLMDAMDARRTALKAVAS
jgi:hypothetical protein